MKLSSAPRLAHLFNTLASLSVAAVGCGRASVPDARHAEASDTGASPTETSDAGAVATSAPPPADAAAPSAPLATAEATASTDGGTWPIPKGVPGRVCEGTTRYEPLVGVSPAVPVDYLELRTLGVEERTPGAPVFVSTVAKVGRPCATAKEPTACAKAFAKVTVNSGWQVGFHPEAPLFEHYIVYTRGDEVGVVTSLAALATFLAPVDNAKDAALLATENDHRIDCNKDRAQVSASGVELTTDTGSTCGAGTGIDEHLVRVSRAGGIQVVKTKRIVEGNPHCVVGRRPEGYALARSSSERALGAHFAEIAQLEAASVFAFERLARELEAHGAPADLIAAAREAAEDEVRHARTTGALAERFGATALVPTVGPLGVRSLFDIARENATEGCVRETFGALQATIEARQATHPAIARAMAVIAEDETRHAGLAWDLAAWLELRLTDDERARVEQARRDAADELAREVAAHEPRTEVRALAGVPSAAQASWLVAQARPALWS